MKIKDDKELFNHTNSYLKIFHLKLHKYTQLEGEVWFLDEQNALIFGSSQLNIDSWSHWKIVRYLYFMLKEKKDFTLRR